MSTELVVETKTAVIRNYRDVMDKKENYTVDFLERMPHVKEIDFAHYLSNWCYEHVCTHTKGSL